MLYFWILIPALVAFFTWAGVQMARGEAHTAEIAARVDSRESATLNSRRRNS